ncbi:MAG TPA: DUF4382 domain-containing protein [Steroidobacteraceae bacterium]|nr:DUF4382 domain-containing protein [Steroidobacteraceae bacterium]
MLYGLRKLLALVAMIAAISACSTRTYVAATGSTPPQYTHVYLTIGEVWFSSDDSAQATDSNWSKFSLTEPVTVDLVTASNGTLAKIIGALRLPPGEYSQIRLIPVDNTVALTDSAKALSATYNNEIDYVDSSIKSHQVPLEILNPADGISARGSLSVSLGGGALPIAASSRIGNSTTANTSNSGPTILNFAVNINAATDIALFSYGAQEGAVLNSHAQAFDLAKMGGISGTLTLTNLVDIRNASARLNITATAETLSADGSRHVAVLSAPVNADGTFLLYPLPANDSTKNPTTYDVVIHGASIETIIIKGVEVKRSSSGSSSSASSNMTVGVATVSVGTLIPQTTTSHALNLTSSTSLPAGAMVSFYQTLPGSGEVPYVIEQSVINPFGTTMYLDQPVSSGIVQTGNYATDIQSITLTNITPVEGNGGYTVAASATSFTDGALNVVVTAPSSGTAQVTPAAITATGTSHSVSIAVAHASNGSYNKGQLILSRDGTIFATASLDAVLASASGGNVTLSNVPGGNLLSPFASGIYDVTVRMWNSQDPATTLQRRYFPAAVDVRSGNAAGVSITIN